MAGWTRHPHWWFIKHVVFMIGTMVFNIDQAISNAARAQQHARAYRMRRCVRSVASTATWRLALIFAHMPRTARSAYNAAAPRINA